MREDEEHLREHPEAVAGRVEHPACGQFRDRVAEEGQAGLSGVAGNAEPVDGRVRDKKQGLLRSAESM